MLPAGHSESDHKDRTSKLVKPYQSSSVITQGRFARDVLPFVNRRLVTIVYGCSIVAEQEHTIQSWTSRVKHPMLRLSQNFMS